MARKTSISPLVLALFGNVVAAYMWLVRHTLRWEVVGEDNHDRLIKSDKSFILTSWHGRLFMMPALAYKYHNGAVSLSSNHKDAELMVAVLKRCGIDAIRGSSSNARKPEKKKGGVSAFRQLLSAAKQKKVIGMTPDGPRGPAYQAELGTVQLARMTGAPILPFSFSTRHSKRFSGWDKFMLPYPIPFGKAYIVFGTPIDVTARDESGLDEARVQLEQALNNVAIEADRLAGLAPDPELFNSTVEAPSS